MGKVSTKYPAEWEINKLYKDGDGFYYRLVQTNSNNILDGFTKAKSIFQAEKKVNKIVESMNKRILKPSKKNVVAINAYCDPYANRRQK
ncbi:MAG: hypothetical protein DWQ49_09785 [Bacteroidetes bacterium]|nr:MAG: hypothetical protein DWQ49_09785 [Bacteroidota bacterium]